MKEASLGGKKILLRSDLNVPIENGMIQDEKRIDAALESIREIIIQRPGVLVIVSHLGRPGGEYKEKLSLSLIKKDLEKKIKKEIILLASLKELKKVKNKKDGQIFLLENIRFWPGEKENGDDFSEKIASGFDVYINDAFSASHRGHASISGFSRYTKEKYTGLLFDKELIKLSQVRDNPKKPAIAIIGGAKFETKLPVIENLREIYDFILVGGLVANEALDQGLDLGAKVFLPVDFAPDELVEQRLDIGPETIKIFKEKISQAKTIIWNGPMGKFEDPEAENGTKEIMRAIAAEKEVEQVIGGGETLEAVKRFGDFSDFDYVSMSGGAMLEFLAGKKLPGIKVLES